MNAIIFKTNANSDSKPENLILSEVNKNTHADIITIIIMFFVLKYKRTKTKMALKLSLQYTSIYFNSLFIFDSYRYDVPVKYPELLYGVVNCDIFSVMPVVVHFN